MESFIPWVTSNFSWRVQVCKILSGSLEFAYIQVTKQRSWWTLKRDDRRWVTWKVCSMHLLSILLSSKQLCVPFLLDSVNTGRQLANLMMFGCIMNWIKLLRLLMELLLLNKKQLQLVFCHFSPISSCSTLFCQFHFRSPWKYVKWFRHIILQMMLWCSVGKEINWCL